MISDGVEVARASKRAGGRVSVLTSTSGPGASVQYSTSPRRTVLYCTVAPKAQSGLSRGEATVRTSLGRASKRAGGRVSPSLPFLLRTPLLTPPPPAPASRVPTPPLSPPPLRRVVVCVGLLVQPGYGAELLGAHEVMMNCSWK